MRELLFYLLCALPVDFEQDIGAGLHFLFGNQQARSAIVITVDFGGFQKFPGFAPRQKILGSRGQRDVLLVR